VVPVVKEKPVGGDRRERKIQGWREGFGLDEPRTPGLVRLISPWPSPRSRNQSIDSEAEILPTPQIFPSFVDDGVYPPPSTKSQEQELIEFFLYFY